MSSTNSEKKPLMTRREVAEHFGVHVNTVDNWRKSGALKALKVAPAPKRRRKPRPKPHIRFRREDVERLIREEK
jgi:transposase